MEEIGKSSRQAVLEAFGELDAVGIEELDAEASGNASLVEERKELAEVAEALQMAAAFEKYKGEPVPIGLAGKMERAWQEISRNDEGKVVSGSWTRWRGAVLALAACLAAVFAVVALLRDEVGISVVSPRGDIVSTSPTLEWENDPDPERKYDVWILPAEGNHLEAPVLFVKKGVRSPLAFSQLDLGPAAPSTGMDALEEGGEYRLLVCHADRGKMSGTPVRFSVEKR